MQSFLMSSPWHILIPMALYRLHCLISRVSHLKPVLEFLSYRHCIDQNVSCETNCCSVDQEFPALYETRRFIALFTEQVIDYCKRLNKERVMVCDCAVGELRTLRIFRTSSFSTLSNELKIPDVSGFLQHLNNINNFIKCNHA
jgi:hypothetical protein